MKKLIFIAAVLFSGCTLQQNLGKSGCTIHEFATVSIINDSIGVYVVCPANVIPTKFPKLSQELGISKKKN